MALVRRRQQIRLQANEQEGIVEFDASFPTHGEAFELMEQGEGLLDDVAELAQALDVRSALAAERLSMRSENDDGSGALGIFVRSRNARWFAKRVAERSQRSRRSPAARTNQGERQQKAGHSESLASADHGRNRPLIFFCNTL
ncbi:hypothetical protein ACFWFI_41720 [Streptomyces sp. NPDC060209]|uniref:hypothetical protein n=1 Tax=Streptomyces sp. NPDC060209 TaxID=3347073 RepID=UPI0036462CF9